MTKSDLHGGVEKKKVDIKDGEEKWCRPLDLRSEPRHRLNDTPEPVQRVKDRQFSLQTYFILDSVQRSLFHRKKKEPRDLSECISASKPLYKRQIELLF